MLTPSPIGPARRRSSQRTCTSLVIALLAAVALGGCKAREAKSTGFTQPELMARDPLVPFQKVWIKPGVELRQYKRIYVADVNTAYMLRQTEWQKGERKDQIEADVKRLGAYTKKTIETAFRNDLNKHYEVLSAPPENDPDAIHFEMALTEVVPSKVVLNALGYVPFGIGMGISAFRALAQDQSSVAFELRVRDGASGEIIAMAADRESQQFAPVSVRGLTWYSHAEVAIAQWAQQFVRVHNRKPGEKIKDTDTITLQPW